MHGCGRTGINSTDDVTFARFRVNKVTNTVKHGTTQGMRGDEGWGGGVNGLYRRGTQRRLRDATFLPRRSGGIADAQTGKKTDERKGRKGQK